MLCVYKKLVRNIPLGADHRAFQPDANVRACMRDALGFSSDDIVIVYSGKISAGKDPAIILDACMPIAAAYNLKFLFVGNVENRYRPRFQAACGDGGRVVHVPGVLNSDLPKYYNAADIASAKALFVEHDRSGQHWIANRGCPRTY